MFVAQRVGGASRYFVELARALQGLRDVRARLFAPAHLNDYIQKTDALHPFSFRADWPQRGLQYRVTALQPVLRMALALSAPDVLHETSYAPVGVRVPSRTRVVTTVHDMAFERFPQLFDDPAGRIAGKLAGMRRADAIVCVSDHTRRELLAIYPEFESRCAVVPHGVLQQAAAGERPAALPGGDYLLYVGTRHTYKNFLNLLRALGAAPELPPHLKLLCFGGGPISPEERQVAAESAWAADRLVHIAGDDNLLAQAYRHALLFVFPSTYEGFGMPLTEAMVQGCAVACSRASCFPEVCGSAAAYFDADDPADIARCLQALVLQPEPRQALAQAGLRHVQRFTWARCAEQTLAVYQQTSAAMRMALR
jgi:glycosyltransferase involved in cell wall biosynthesis